MFTQNLVKMRKIKDETLRKYFSWYWEMYKETEDFDLKFALNTFKYGLLKDNNGI